MPNRTLPNATPRHVDVCMLVSSERRAKNVLPYRIFRPAIHRQNSVARSKLLPSKLQDTCDSGTAGQVGDLNGQEQSSIILATDSMTRVIQTHQHNKYSLKSGLWVQLWRCEETNTNQSSQEQWTFPLCRAKAASLRESGRAVLLEVVSAGESALRVEEVMDLGVNGCPSHLKLGHWIGLERGKDNESTEQSSSETKTIQSANRIRKRNFEIIGLNDVCDEHLLTLSSRYSRKITGPTDLEA